MEPVGVLARWRLVLGLIHVVIGIMGLILINLSGLTQDVGVAIFCTYGILYLSLGIVSHAFPWHAFRAFRRITAADQEASLALKLYAYFSLSGMRIIILVSGISQQQSSIFHSFAGNDGWERLCYWWWWVMMLLNCLETLVDCLMYDDPSRSGAIAVPVGNGVDVRVPLGLFGQLVGVLIRCGRVLGGFDGLVAWRLGLSTMGAALLTLVLGGFGSVMTANVLRTCLGLGFLESILVCASRQKMLDMCVRVRYIIISGFKIVLVVYLIVENHLRSLTESSGCKEGSTCYSRLRECFYVMLVFYILELFLAVLLLPLFVHHPRKEIQNMEEHVVANEFGLYLTMSSALSMTQVAIVGLLLGGSYGPLLTTEGFWLCGSTLFAEMAALMGVTDWVAKVLKSQLDTRMYARSAFIIVPALRMFGQLTILIFLLYDRKINERRIYGEKFFITDMSNCDETCKARGRDLLFICAWTVVVQWGFSLYFLVLMLHPKQYFMSKAGAARM